MNESTGFSMKDSLSALGLRWRCFNSMKNDSDEPKYTYNDEYMRFFLRQIIKKRTRMCFQCIL